MGDWTTDSNDALTISLVRSEKDKLTAEDTNLVEFHPTFTYPIYGTDEKLYGYKDLLIDLRLASGSLRTYLNVSYSAKLPPPSPVDDAEAMLQKFLPEDFETDLAKFNEYAEEDSLNFKPYGKKIYEYTKRASGDADGEERQYEVWHAKFDTPGFAAYHRRMQLFILLYIEGGSYVDEDPAWEFVCLYEKRKRATPPSDSSDAPEPQHTYHFMGYSSLYPFYCFPSRVRLRLSQFVILPPFQHAGHGAALYTAIYTYVLATPDVAELTVEDPAEAFEDLRDRCDLRMLVAHARFAGEAFGEGGLGGGVGPVRHGARAKGKGKAKARVGKLGPPVDKAWAEKWRAELKIAGRQFSRLVEMLQLLHVDEADPRAWRAYRLQVKERLYRFNFEVLMQLEKVERQEKLEETFRSVCEDYRRILAMAKV
ncbi:histone acetyltransferase type B [Phanerochaete sordida]|uniref:Histone acetyltransferase type B catalytic subunit n=1 Tax=Phanerochaete sordida TaxID=48140 RepID=A0A9P3G484_9APHY|nr:histone acetyltransferase type B [Phanerochaete sordida]